MILHLLGFQGAHYGFWNANGRCTLAPCCLLAGLTLIFLIIKGPDAWKRHKVSLASVVSGSCCGQSDRRDVTATVVNPE